MNDKPSPRITSDTASFWARCNEGVLSFQRCTGCGQAQFYPGTICRSCQCDTLEWEDAAGHGELHSFTIVHRAPTPAFRGDVPYIVALVDMAEGFRMMANVVEAGPDEMRIGLPVRVVFEQRGADGQQIPQVTPRR